MTKRRWKQRPNGLDGDYDVAHWQDRRIAWEFLRRNSAYQEQCDRIFPAGKSAKQAERYGPKFVLARLLDYTLNWPDVGSKLVVVGLDTHLGQHNLFGEIDEDLFNEGDFAYFQVNLRLALYSDPMLKAQLDDIRTKATEFLRRYRKRKGVPLSKSRGRRPASVEAYQRYLRILDIDAAHDGRAPQAYLAETIYQGKHYTEISNRLSSDRKMAKHYIENGYIKFLVSQPA